MENVIMTDRTIDEITQDIEALENEAFKIQREAMDAMDVIAEAKETIERAISAASNAIYQFDRATGMNKFPGYDAYVFAQLKEGCDNGNPYNQSLRTILESLDDLGAGDEQYDEELAYLRLELAEAKKKFYQSIEKVSV